VIPKAPEDSLLAELQSKTSSDKLAADIITKDSSKAVDAVAAEIGQGTPPTLVVTLRNRNQKDAAACVITVVFEGGVPSDSGGEKQVPGFQKASVQADGKEDVTFQLGPHFLGYLNSLQTKVVARLSVEVHAELAGQKDVITRSLDVTLRPKATDPWS
jgi:hypothetical protein